ncbi:hypothetical protein [Mucilaginibacter phyllosphaerae]|uniref:Uncharacterized protein n=1 Tax=Mucilaginibacter phyllosphaerae TaxID=1812349 RepID=A0A4Y8ACZ0_9SPHI|nr:hypothetical protein [Mucilaginibacter phyllosphaerae]MBB3969294.1 hypothetical protein [Mucilaginibacter phyllosphaerae]TEW65909.1 hypothetical protein E2R65_12305 [Mucilaginibacter phyllosphaerae]GGH07488.1 hypothetical protein GCM10007352_12290 [Mucilaginibacter phyllosphaerae]
MNEQKFLSDQEFADMYNLGYGLNKVSPEIADLISQVRTRSPELDALKAGMENSKEHDKDQSYLPDWLKDDWFKETGKDMTGYDDREMDKD